MAVIVEQEKLDLVDDLVEQGEVTDPRTPKGRLLAKAAKLFRVKGYERTTVRDLAAAVGIQSGSIFHHYKSKEEILLAMMKEVVIYNTHLMRRRIEEADSIESKLLALIKCEIDAINGVTGDAMSVLVYEWRSLSEEKQDYILGLRSEYEGIWMQTLEAAKSDGKVQGDTFVLRRLLTGAISWTTTWYDPKGSMDLDALSVEALHLVIKQ
ncbi:MULTISPECIES: TetR/AcrR family transcriptional regulator [unclassified Oleiphilus]|uniref:TetR/AcrR family transcriptional regulator n=1 Tax=unclassified Oleiphilus TaxID=2631174 RepID=UPI000A4D2839|nr:MULTISPECIES: TetR family transcriptional regulator [unclassified Oleiphilus]